MVFLFTDLENSTRLWELYPESMKGALARHDQILKTAVESRNGRVVKSTGDGLNAVFNSAVDGLQACLEAQIRLQQEIWEETGPLLVRMGLHLGEAQPRAGDYYGSAVNRAARLMAVAHGGQVLLSEAVANMAADRLPDGVSLKDLHQHRLKDLERPEHIFQLLYPGLREDFPPLSSLSQRPNNLPTQTSSFLGRESELAAIKERLTGDGVRLLSLTGPGGTGKTRLALQAAADLIDAFDDGVFFVDLAPIRDPEAVITAIGRAIGLPEAKEGSKVDVLASQLRDRQLLLLLDNFEQVTAAAISLLELLESCPGLKMLVTTREALHVRGEQLYAIPPLGTPASELEGLTLDQIGQVESVQLFVQRAQAVRPDFSLTAKNAGIVAEICRRLDGLPLAVELAAARIRLFPPPALLARLEHSLKLLRGGARDLPVRQQTLQDTIAWSHDLLDAAEKHLFTLFSVFSGATFEAVEAVSGRLELPNGGEADVIDGLISLIDKSLIRRLDGDDGDSRLVMLGTIREFAAGQLADDETLNSTVKKAHATYYADFAQGCWSRLGGRERDSALGAMQDEFENLQTAWQYWTEERELDQLKKLVDSLWQLYDARGWYHATVDLTTDLLDILSTTPSSPERVQQEIMLYTSLARVLLATRGYTSEAENAYRHALKLSELAGEIPQQFPVLRGMYNFYVYRSEFDKAKDFGQRILHLAESRDDDEMRVTGLYALGTNTGFLDNLPQGLSQLDQAISHYDVDRRHNVRFRAGNDPGVVSHTTSAFFLWALGKPDSALERTNRGLELARQLNHPLSITYALFHSGFLNLWLRKPEITQDRAISVLEMAGKHQFQIWIALGTCLRGAAMTGLGQSEQGLALIREGKALYQGLTTPPVFWPLLIQMEARACLKTGEAGTGLALMEEVMLASAESGQDAGESGGAWLVSETLSLIGDLYLAQFPARQAEAEGCFQQAINVATTVKTRMPELRAAIRLGRLWQEQGRGKEAFDQLSAVYHQFTEGFAMPDLLEAKDLLEELSAAYSS